jgi:hypothetical protein
VAFFTDLGGGRFLANEATTGPWDARYQHGGPPSALLGRAIEQTQPRPDAMVARVTVEILGAVPVGELTVHAEVVRPGRSVELLEASMSAGDRVVARARAWRVTRTHGMQVDPRVPAPAPVPEAAGDGTVPGWVDGYLQAIEWRWVRGHLSEPGPAVAWGRMRHPLVDDEQPSPLTRVLVLADSGNGVSSELTIDRWLFINPELTVHLHREAEGEWVCLDAVTTISDGGVGLATSVLSDGRGPIGHGAQTLLVQPR